MRPRVAGRKGFGHVQMLEVRTGSTHGGSRAEAGVRSEEPGAASQPLLAVGRGGKTQKKWGSLLFFSPFLTSQACQTRRPAAGLLFIDDFCFGES